VPASPAFHQWNNIPKEQMNPQLARRFVTGERVMVAQMFLAKGCSVPKHAHDNEQVTMVMQGALTLRLGDDEKVTHTVRPGEVLVIPPNLPHSAVADEDSMALDVFGPPRADWLAKDDAYLRK
jgi:quercetin dioxygenase-like cupin family protein